MIQARRPVRQRLSRAVEVQEAVKEIILERGLAAGDPLPTESELMDELGIGRNSVREALKALQAVGIVEIRHGFGMFVGRMSLTGLVDELAFHSRITMQDGRNHLGHLIEIREVLESGLVLRLIDQHTGPGPGGPVDPGLDLAGTGLDAVGGPPDPVTDGAADAAVDPAADLLPITEVIERMEAEALVGAISPETDRLFHEALYRPLGNPLVGQLLGAFWEVYYQLRDDLGMPDEPPADVARWHRDIYEAVVTGDRTAATTAMRAHFHGVRHRLARLR
jgi:DNA-binding FadR family transcriptional regulator